VAAVTAICAGVCVAISLTYLTREAYTVTFILIGAFAVLAYTAVFALFAALDRRTAARVLPIVEAHGTDGASAIADALGWREKSTVKFISKLKRWGYYN